MDGQSPWTDSCPWRAGLLSDGAALLLLQEADPGGGAATDVAILGGLGEGAERLLRLLLLEVGDPGQELEIGALFTTGIGGGLGLGEGA